VLLPVHRLRELAGASVVIIDSGHINTTLRYALESWNPEWKVIPDNFMIRIHGNGVDDGGFKDALRQMVTPEYWQDETQWAGIAALLPTYRLSKFQPLMPNWIEREIVARYLLDTAGAWQWLETLADSDVKRVSQSPGD